MNILPKIFLIFCMLNPFICASSQNYFNLNNRLMENTYKIVGDGSVGTSFLLIHYINDTKAAYILVTATHVLSNMKGDSATIFLRTKSDGIYSKLGYKFPIRANNKNLYLSHKNADVSIIRFPWPNDAYRPNLIPDYFLANDSALEKNQVAPGYEVFCLGFPLGTEANNAGFPILRSGNIASFPLYPTKIYPEFYVDIKAFKGTSGGPVYYSKNDLRGYLGTRHGERGFYNYEYILGLVSEEKLMIENKQSIYGEEKKVTQMDIIVVIHATYIKELIDLIQF